MERNEVGRRTCGSIARDDHDGAVAVDAIGGADDGPVEEETTCSGRGDPPGTVIDVIVERALVPVHARYAGRGAHAAEIRMTTRRSPQRRRPTEHGWTKARRKLFLETLAATHNARMSAATVKMCVRGARRLRERDAEFSALWEQALAAGRERLRDDLFAYALGYRSSGDNPEDVDFDTAARAPFDPQLALKVLAMAEGAVPAGRRRNGPPSQGEVDAALLRRIAALGERGGG